MARTPFKKKGWARPYLYIEATWSATSILKEIGIDIAALVRHYLRSEYIDRDYEVEMRMYTSTYKGLGIDTSTLVIHRCRRPPPP